MIYPYPVACPDCKHLWFSEDSKYRGATERCGKCLSA